MQQSRWCPCSLNYEKPLASGLQLTTCKLTTSQLPQLVHKVRGRYGIADLVESNQVGQVLCCIYRWASKLKPTKLEGLRAIFRSCKCFPNRNSSAERFWWLEHSEGFSDIWNLDISRTCKNFIQCSTKCTPCMSFICWHVRGVLMVFGCILAFSSDVFLVLEGFFRPSNFDHTWSANTKGCVAKYFPFQSDMGKIPIKSGKWWKRHLAGTYFSLNQEIVGGKVTRKHALHLREDL